MKIWAAENVLVVRILFEEGILRLVLSWLGFVQLVNVYTSAYYSFCIQSQYLNPFVDFQES